MSKEGPMQRIFNNFFQKLDEISFNIKAFQKTLQEILKILLILPKLSEITIKLDELQAATYSSKLILTFSEGCKYLGISESHGYKLTSRLEVPFFRSGKLIYFDRIQLEQWVKRNPVLPRQIQSTKAVTFVNSKTARP